MRPHIVLRAALAATLAFLLIGPFHPAKADPEDYEFKLVETSIKQGNGVIIAFRLIDKRSGKPIPDAVIFSTRIDMEPDGMEAMTSKIELLPSTEPGTYRVRTNLTMEGGWRLSLGARVQGETAPIQSKLVLKAVP